MNLITGATGIVGAHVAFVLLQKGESVTATKRHESDVSKTKKLFSYYTSDYEILFNKLKWVDADVCDIYSIIDALEGITNVYHCAGFVTFDKKNNQQLYKINVDGTANVVNACLEKNIQHLCHVSSIAAIQNPDVTKNIDEKVYWKSSPTVSDYAISKYNGEREVWRGIEEGLKAVIVNPGIILGPGFWDQSSGKLVKTCFKGTSFYTRGSSTIVNAMDVARCMVSLTEKKISGKRYILAENNYTFKEILTLIQQQFNHKAPTIEAGKVLLTLAKYGDAIRCAFTNKERVITKDMIQGTLEINTYNNALIKSELNYNFISFKDTATFICNAFLNDLKK